jgi:putative inorganic carbon (HCO3(-)) transporter
MTSRRLEQIAVAALVGSAGALQFSIAAGQILLAVTVACWLAMLVAGRQPFRAPRIFWPLAVYAGLTLVSAAFSPQPKTSLVDCKQLVLFLLVPITYQLMNESRAQTLLSVVMALGAASAAVGIFEFGILHFDSLGRRPQGTLGHYMTYSGLLMLVICVALARVLFSQRERTWAVLVMPALLVAVAVTLSRNAWVGACVAAALLFSLKDFRLLAVLPVVAAVFFGIAPTTMQARFVSIFNKADNLDRVAMMQEGMHMVRDHPVLGVGPNMVQALYEEYRVPFAVQKVNPHLHNVPLQIAAERGLPALAAWLGFIVLLLVELGRRFRAGRQRFLTSVALASVVSMLAAGMFEYNFGDSEFLMLFLILVTLPFAVERSQDFEAGRLNFEA